MFSFVLLVMITTDGHLNEKNTKKRVCPPRDTQGTSKVLVALLGVAESEERERESVTLHSGLLLLVVAFESLC